MELLEYSQTGFVVAGRSHLAANRSFQVRIAGWRARSLLRGLKGREHPEARLAKQLALHDLPLAAGVVGLAPLFALAVLAKGLGWSFRSEIDRVQREVVVEFMSPAAR
jgi:hypothetical protein